MASRRDLDNILIVGALCIRLFGVTAKLIKKDPLLYNMQTKIILKAKLRVKIMAVMGLSIINRMQINKPRNNEKNIHII